MALEPDAEQTSPTANGQRSRGRTALLRLHREIVQLAVLILIAIGAFIGTRAIAIANRETNLHDAAEWYRRGEDALRARRIAAAVEAFRRATARNRGEREYALALARALTLNGETDASRSALLALRDSHPDDVDVNVQLARLAAKQGDVEEALQFYRAALYAPWAADHAPERRAIRVELIKFLIARQQRDRATSELIAMSSSLPDDPSLHIDVAQLFLAAGDRRHALDQFEQVLRRDPHSSTALTGAGLAAFDLGQYALAREYLRRAPADEDEVKQKRDSAELVLSRDPLAARIGAAERRRRLETSLSCAGTRLNGCPAAVTGSAAEVADARERRRRLHGAVAGVRSPRPGHG